MFAYPKNSEFNRVVPKAKIYAHTRVSKRVKELFVSQVGEIVWRYKLSPETINLPARNGIREIQVFDIHLKTPEIDDAVLVAIDKAIPFPLICRLINQDAMRDVMSHKRPSETDPTKWVIGDRFRSTPYAIGSASKSLPVALDMEAFYGQLLRSFVPLPARPGESLASRLTRWKTLQAKEKACKQLEAQLAKERQFNRKVELNAALRSLVAEAEMILACPENSTR